MTIDVPSPGSDSVSNGRAVGVVIAACAALSILAIAHHPTVASHSPSEALAGIARFANLDRLVHGALIAFMGGLLAAFWAYSQRRGFDRLPVVAGLGHLDLTPNSLYAVFLAHAAWYASAAVLLLRGDV